MWYACDEAAIERKTRGRTAEQRMITEKEREEKDGGTERKRKGGWGEMKYRERKRE